MKALLLIVAMAGLAYLVLNQKPQKTEPATPVTPAKVAAPSYVLTGHRVEHDGIQEDYYTVTFNNEVMTVRYHDSQTHTAKPGDPAGSGLQQHIYYHDPDLSLIPALGVPIRQCEGSLSIAAQSVPDPCIVKIEDILRYEPKPNADRSTYVVFNIVSEEIAGNSR